MAYWHVPERVTVLFELRRVGYVPPPATVPISRRHQRLGTAQARPLLGLLSEGARGSSTSSKACRKPAASPRVHTLSVPLIGHFETFCHTATFSHRFV